MLADGSDTGRLLWEQPSAAIAINWGVLWRSLRANVADERYHAGRSMLSFAATADGVEVVLEDGTTDRYDLLVGADGYRSAVRSHVHSGSAPHYAGYILWRGNYPEARVEDRVNLDRAVNAFQTVVFDGGHSIFYMIPDFDNQTDLGRRRVNWAIYTPQPPGLDFTEPTSITPGEVSEELYSYLDTLLTRVFHPRCKPSSA